MAAGKTGFTLIELLIVVAIIAILAAIAVPNFLEAQTRAKVSRVKSDLRTLATGLEAYRVDGNGYPPSPIPFGNPAAQAETWRLTTPVAFLATIPIDGFVPGPGSDALGGPYGLGGIYLHYLNDKMLGEHWISYSYGPDRDFEPEEIHYDPTNGTISDGDIFRTGARQ